MWLENNPNPAPWTDDPIADREQPHTNSPSDQSGLHAYKVSESLVAYDSG